MNIWLFPQVRGVDTMGIDSINSTLSMSIIVWHDSGLNIMFFFAKSLWIQILFESILILSMASVFASSSSMISSLFENSICVHVRSNLPKLSGACCHFSGTFRTVLYSCPILFYYLRFHEAAGFANSFSTLPLVLVLEFQALGHVNLLFFFHSEFCFKLHHQVTLCLVRRRYQSSFPLRRVPHWSWFDWPRV